MSTAAKVNQCVGSFHPAWRGRFCAGTAQAFVARATHRCVARRRRHRLGDLQWLFSSGGRRDSKTARRRGNPFRPAGLARPSPQLLAEGRLLALDVDLDHSGQIGSTADVQIEFGRETVRVFSLFGYRDWDYPGNYVIAFNRNELEPRWGAWAAELLLLAEAAAILACC